MIINVCCIIHVPLGMFGYAEADIVLGNTQAVSIYLNIMSNIIHNISFISRITWIDITYAHTPTNGVATCNKQYNKPILHHFIFLLECYIMDNLNTYTFSTCIERLQKWYVTIAKCAIYHTNISHLSVHTVQQHGLNIICTSIRNLIHPFWKR